MAEERPPTEEELRAAVGRITVADTVVSMATGVVSLGFHKVSAETRDLPQARFAIETLRALEPVLREHGVDEALVRDLEQARANLQLAYATAVADAGSSSAPDEPSAGEAADRQAAEGGDASGAAPTNES